MPAALLLPYVLFPLLMAGWAALAGPDAQPWRNVIDLAWAALALLATLELLRQGRWPRLSAKAAWPWLLAALAVMLRFGPALLDSRAQLTPLLMELKPLAYLAVAGLLAAAGPLPRSADFGRAGAVLAVLLLAEVLARSLWEGRITRPEGSGEINYDALLLLLAWIMDRHGAEASPGAPARRTLLLLGMLASLSRTVLLTLGLLLALEAPARTRNRPWLLPLLWTAAAGLALAGVWASFQVRELSFHGLQSLDRYWMWLAGARLLVQHPLAALHGFLPGIPLPVDVPPALAFLWTMQAGNWALEGVFAYNFHALWLRLAITWGLPAALAALAGCAATALRGGPRLRQLALTMLLCGLTMGPPYLSNVTVPLLLALFRVLAHDEPAASPGLLAPGPALAIRRRTEKSASWNPGHSRSGACP